MMENSFSRQWNDRPSLYLKVGTTFYAGQLVSVLRYTEYNHSRQQVDYRSLFLSLGWSYSNQIINRVYLGSAINFGNNFMYFEKAKVYTSAGAGWKYPFDQMESEFAYEISLTTGYKITDRLALCGSLSYKRMLTYHPVSVTFLSGGIRYSFSTPGWVKTILQ